MQKIFSIIQNRNTLLAVSLLVGFLYDDFGFLLKDYTIYILAVVMTFSTTGISFKMLAKFKSVGITTIQSIVLNFIIHGIVILIPAYFLFDDKSIFWGFVVIAATPPGIAVIPFTLSFKGDLDYSFRGVLGTYLSAIIITPLIIGLFVQDSTIPTEKILFVILKVIAVPLIISRILLIKKIFPTVEKIRGKVVDWGFAFIIYTAIAINRDAIFSDIEIVLKSALIFSGSIFLLGYLYNKLMKKRVSEKLLISQNLMLTIKSSGFAIATTLALFDEKAAIPSAVMSIFILLYLLYLGIKFDIKNKRNK